jgi:hypothetical protein
VLVSFIEITQTEIERANFLRDQVAPAFAFFAEYCGLMRRAGKLPPSADKSWIVLRP